MEKTAFTNVEQPWWLLKDDRTESVDERIVRARLTLAENLKFSQDWFKDQRNVEDLFEVLRSKNEKLINDLDYLNSIDQNVEWLEEIVNLTTAPPAPAAQSIPTSSQAAPAAAPPAAPPTAAPPTAWDPERQMIYRLKADNTYEFAFSDDQRTIRPGSPWMSEQEANDAVQAAKARPDPAPPPRPEPEAKWDESWGMIYRIGPDGNHQFAFSDDQLTIRPNTTWMTRDQAVVARAAAAQPDTIDVETVVADAITQLTADVTTSLAEELKVDAGDIAGLAENDRFKEIMKEVIEGRLAAAAAS